MRRHGTESPAIRRRIACLEDRLGKAVVIRGVRHRNRSFRGRILSRPGCFVVEYRDDIAGYFWHYEIIEELLNHLEHSRCNVVVYEGDIQYTDVSPNSPCNMRTPER